MCVEDLEPTRDQYNDRGRNHPMNEADGWGVAVDSLRSCTGYQLLKRHNRMIKPEYLPVQKQLREIR
jgi:hypothetical protein